MIRKSSVVVLMVVLIGCLSTGLAFAGGKQETVATATKPASSAVKFWWYDMINQPIYVSLANQFEKKTGIHINLQGYAGWGTMHQKEMLAVAGGNAPDAAIEKPLNMPDLASRGALMNLGPYIQKAGLSKDTWFKVQIGYDSIYNGKIYDLPFWMASEAFLINQTLFQKAGFNPNDPPKTWSQAVADAKKMTNASSGIYGLMVNAYGSNDPNPFMMIAAEDGAHMFTTKNDHPVINVDSPQAIQALQFLYDVIYKYKVAPPPGTMSEQLAFNQRVGMWVDNNDVVPNLRKLAPDVNYESAVMPAGTVNNVAIEMSASLDEFAHAKNPQAAFKWIEYLSTNRQNQIKFAQATGLFPSMPSAVSDPAFSGPHLGGWQKIAETQDFTPRPVALGGPQIYQDIGDAVQAVLTKKETPAQALKIAQKQIDAVLSNPATS